MTREQKRIELIIGTSGRFELIADLIRGGHFKVTPVAGELLQGIPLATVETKLIVVIRSLRELGLENGGSFEDIYGAGQRNSLTQVPGETGPRYRLRYRDQRGDEYIRMMMEPLPTSKGTSIFSVYRGHLGTNGPAPSQKKNAREEVKLWGKTTLWAFAEQV